MLRITYLHLRMYVRKKKNRSGTTSIVVVKKLKGIYREIKTIGTSKDASEIESLFSQGKRWISSHLCEQDIFELHDKALEERQVTEYLLSNVENILLNGEQLILNKVFKHIGFEQVEDEIFRQLVIARLSSPMSKSATVEYLKSHFDEDTQLHRIYRYLDKLYTGRRILRNTKRPGQAYHRLFRQQDKEGQSQQGKRHKAARKSLSQWQYYQRKHQPTRL